MSRVDIVAPKKGSAMRISVNRPDPDASTERRRPTFPAQRTPGGLFLGWGPKIQG